MSAPDAARPSKASKKVSQTCPFSSGSFTDVPPVTVCGSPVQVCRNTMVVPGLDRDLLGHVEERAAGELVGAEVDRHAPLRTVAATATPGREEGRRQHRHKKFPPHGRAA